MSFLFNFNVREMPKKKKPRNHNDNNGRKLTTYN